MSVHRVIVRMYRQLLGDCFLIRIEDSVANRHILIDCGLLQGLKDAGDRMRAVAEDIAAATGGHLDLLVVTHEHWDHISGFAQARDIFFAKTRLRIDRLWMAWTENPDDDDARRLRARFDDRKQALTAVAMAMQARATALMASDASEADTVSRLLENLENFVGPVDATPGLGVVPTGRFTGRRILEELKTAAGTVDYLQPGQVVTTPGDTPLRVAVLGPPRDETLLFKDLPTGGGAHETYLAENFLAASFLGVDGSADGGATLATASPFSARYWSGRSRAEVAAAAAGDPGADPAWLHDHYIRDTDDEDRPQAWRRIDDSAGNAAALALKLDSDTNNTSLVLAFELPDKTFMVFAADAQVGNWLSWHKQDYPFDGCLSAEDILNQTRLYKVGHHGSHNATLDQKGLAMMTRDDLVAMVSTVEAEAKTQGRPPGWLMPNPRVADALDKRCQGRVLRGDLGWTDDPARPQPALAAALDQENPLYLEYTVFPAAA